MRQFWDAQWYLPMHMCVPCHTLFFQCKHPGFALFSQFLQLFGRFTEVPAVALTKERGEGKFVFVFILFL